ncbi:hypothetical protein L228DRAFT_284997 [Xylona heveae TC161]|uniref:Spindle pole body associated protein SnaD n=1 Tax=Xylona heveae (strain CBS 132557 / TC161) TaxID=1328760 RepID=A0A165ACZ6_XYLHT|nr:hypothetical protein L228DRAFT_284997 [Xylona heveae TC161]KZF20273.1 hypothetical protein L228DRAFT_284997 [Xylona heveae TC161]
MEALTPRSVSPDGNLSIASSMTNSTPEARLDALRTRQATRSGSSAADADDESMTDFTANLEEYVNGNVNLDKTLHQGKDSLSMPPRKQHYPDDRSEGSTHHTMKEANDGPSDFTQNMERWMRDTIERDIGSTGDEIYNNEDDVVPEEIPDDQSNERARVNTREGSSFYPVDASTPDPKAERRLSNESKRSNMSSQSAQPPAATQARAEEPVTHDIDEEREELKVQISNLLQQVESLHKSALDIQRAKERAETVAAAQERRLKDKDAEILKIQDMVERITELQEEKLRDKDEELSKLKALTEEKGKAQEQRLKNKDEELAKFKEELDAAKKEIHDELAKLQELRTVQPRPVSDPNQAPNLKEIDDLRKEVQQLRSKLAQTESVRTPTGSVNSPKKTRFSLPGVDYEGLWPESESKIKILEAELKALQQHTAANRAGDIASVRHLETSVDGIKIDVSGTQQDIAFIKVQADTWKSEALSRISALENALESTRQEASDARVEATAQGAKVASEMKVVTTDMDRSKTETGLKIAALEAEVTSIKYDSTTHIESLKLQIRSIQRDLDETNRLLQSTEKDSDAHSRLIESQASEIKSLNLTISKYERESLERQDLLDQYSRELKELGSQLEVLRKERSEQSLLPESNLSRTNIDQDSADEFEIRNQRHIEELKEENRRTIEHLGQKHDEEVSKLKDLLLKAGEGMKNRESRLTSEHAKEIEVREDQIRSLEIALAQNEEALAESEEALAKVKRDVPSKRKADTKARKQKVRFEDESSDNESDVDHDHTRHEDETDMSLLGPPAARTSRSNLKTKGQKSSTQNARNAKSSKARTAGDSEESDNDINFDSAEETTQLNIERADSKPKPHDESSSLSELRQAVSILSKKLNASQTEAKLAQTEYARLAAEAKEAKAEIQATKNDNDEINRALERKLAEKWRAKEREWHRRLDVLEKDKRDMAKVLMQQWGKMEVGETDPLQKYKYQYVMRTEKGKEQREKLRQKDVER